MKDKVKLSERLRPDVECAPWVIEEIKKLEQDMEDAYRELIKQVNGSKVVFDRDVVVLARKRIQ
jgi:hypothetical protein